MQHDPARAVLGAARRAARSVDAPLLLAVSGGLDSMALLSAMATVAHARIAGVATFDHGTGRASTLAAAHVVQAGEAMGLPVFVGHLPVEARPRANREDAWRRARHAFLSRTAAALGARIVIAHTEDDQIETVLMRVMRGSGARGLAGLLAPGPLLRPFIDVRRSVLDTFGRDAGVRWFEDPSNRSRVHLRNRLRLDLLPALRAVRPAIDEELLEIGRTAARWRATVERMIDRDLVVGRDPDGSLRVARAELLTHDRDSLAMLWGALALRAGLAPDRRGTRRAAEFISGGSTAGVIPLSRGWRLEARHDAYVLHRRVNDVIAPVALPREGAVEWGGFRFRVTFEVTADSVWGAAVIDEQSSSVRCWGAGDRLTPSSGQPSRRVKRYLSDAGLRGSERARWPVVVAGNDVVWIPGVRRSDAATERSGRPVRHYVCERIDR